MRGEDNRRMAHGKQVGRLAALAMKSPVKLISVATGRAAGSVRKMVRQALKSSS